MELDDLKLAWAELGRRVEATEALALDLRRERQRDKSRRSLSWLTLGTTVAIGIWMVVVATVAPFWIANRHVPHLIVAGLALHLYGVVAIIASVIQLLLIGRTYYTAPIVLMQRRLAELYRFRVYCQIVLILPWWLLWVAALIVGARILGFDIYADSPAWIYWNLAAGVAGLALTGWLARRVSARPPRSKWLRRIADDLAGRSLMRAARHLEDVDRFERE
jgi:hypothetical protein